MKTFEIHPEPDAFGRQELEQRCDMIEHALEQQDASSSLWIELAQARFELGRFNEALTAAAEACTLAAPPQRFEAWFIRASILAHAGRLSEAAEALSIAAGIPGADQVETLVRRAEILETLLRHEEALACYDRVLTQQPLPFVWNLKGSLLAVMERHEDALMAFDAALTHDAGSPEASVLWFNRGHVLQRLGRKREAADSLSRAIKVDPTSADAWCDLGLLILSLGDPAGARKAIEQAIALRERHGWYWLSLARACALSGDASRAGEALEKAIVHDPSLRDDARRFDELGSMLG